MALSDRITPLCRRPVSFFSGAQCESR